MSAHADGDVQGGFRALDRVQATELRRRYKEYQLREAQAFLHLIPREGVRPLYGAAREWAKGLERHDPQEPMTALLGYVLQRLPLPPFEVWMGDLEANRYEHVVTHGLHPASGTTLPPTPVERRSLRHRSRHWNARLELFKDGPRWRGFIAFQSGRRTAPSAQPESFRTANIFVEHDPDAIRDRFRDYHEETLRGFLRSVLP